MFLISGNRKVFRRFLKHRSLTSAPAPAQREPIKFKEKKETSVLIENEYGMDISLSSPAIAFICPDSKQLHVWFLDHVRKSRQSVGSQKKIVFHPVVMNHGETKNYASQEDYLAEMAPKLLYGLQSNRSVRIEDYIYHANNSQSVTILAETSGVIKFLLKQQNPHRTIHKVNTKTVKKFFGGDGRANKYKMYKEFDRWFPEWSEIIQKYFKWKFNPSNPEQHIPHPIEDIVDAIGILDTNNV